MRSTAFVAVAGDLNAQTEKKRYIGGRLSVPADGTDNGDRLIQVSFDHSRFLTNTDFATISDTGSPRALLRLHNVGLRLTAVLLATDSVHQSRNADHSGPLPFSQILL